MTTLKPLLLTVLFLVGSNARALTCVQIYDAYATSGKGTVWGQLADEIELTAQSTWTTPRELVNYWQYNSRDVFISLAELLRSEARNRQDFFYDWVVKSGGIIKRNSVKFSIRDMVAKFHGEQDKAIKAGRVAESDLIRLGASFTRPDGTHVALPWGAPVPAGYQRTTGVVTSDDWLGFLADGISTIDGSEPAILNQTQLARMFDHSIRHTAAFGGDLAFGKAFKEAAKQYRVAPAASKPALAENLHHLAETFELVDATRLRKVLKSGGMPPPDLKQLSDPVKVKKFFASLSDRKLRKTHEYLRSELNGAMVYFGAVSADPYIRFTVLEGRLSRATIDVTGGSMTSSVVPYGSMMTLSRKTRDLNRVSHELDRFMSAGPIYEELRQKYHDQLAEGLSEIYLLAELLSLHTSDWWVRAYTQFDGPEFAELVRLKCAGWPMPYHSQLNLVSCP